MKYRVSLVLLLAVIFYNLLLVPVVLANINYREDPMANAVFSVIPNKTVVKAGEDFLIEVKVKPDPAAPVAGAQFNLGFNPACFKVNSVVEGNLFKLGAAQTYFMPGQIDNAQGTLKNVAGVIIGAGASVTTEGTLAVLNCTAITSKSASSLTLSNTIVGSPAGVGLPLGSSSVTQLSVVASQDFNMDGSVDMADLLIAVAEFGTTGVPGWKVEDLNKDGVINILDLVLVAQGMTP